MASERLTFATRTLSRWPNGAGSKADIASGPGWMAGFAWLDVDAPFSDLSGQDRTIMLLDGPGFSLDFTQAHAALFVRSRNIPRSFDGGWPAQCRILGPCLVLNTMSVRRQWRHDVWVLTTATHVPAQTPGAIAFLVDLTTRDAPRLDGAPGRGDRDERPTSGAYRSLAGGLRREVSSPARR